MSPPHVDHRIAIIIGDGHEGAVMVIHEQWCPACMEGRYPGPIGRTAKSTQNGESHGVEGNGTQQR